MTFVLCCLFLYHHLVPHHCHLIFAWPRKSILYQWYVISCETAAVGEWAAVCVRGYRNISECNYTFISVAHGHSKWSGRSDQPLFWKIQLAHAHFESYRVKGSSYKLCHPQKATKGNTGSRFALVTAVSVHSMAVPLITAMKPKTLCVR